MSTPRSFESSMAMSLNDFYYLVFRHKWKILLLSLAGFAAATALYFFMPPPYQSQAELLIKYVPESTQLALGADNRRVLMPDPRGLDIIHSEIQILTSLDLARQAVATFGASNILFQAGGGTNPVRAAYMIRNNLEAEPSDKQSSVIVVTFKHPNPEIVQPVLQEVIGDYLQKHYEIHSAPGQFDEALSREKAALRVQLGSTEQQLADLKNKASIISFEDSQSGLAAQISRIKAAVLDAQAELSGHEAAVTHLDQSRPQSEKTEDAAPEIPLDQISAYSGLQTRLNALHEKERGYLLQGFTSSNALFQEVSGQIADVQKKIGELESKYPQIAVSATHTSSSSGAAILPGMDIHSHYMQIASLKAKIKAWQTQLEQLQTQATNLNNLAPTIAELQQTKSIQEANYKNLSVSLEKSHVDEALDSGKSPNIKWVQMPSPPLRDWSKATKKLAVLAFGGIFLSLAWAFLIELYLDRSVRRPGEIQSKLKLPLLLSIPDTRRNGHARIASVQAHRQLTQGGDGNGDDDESVSSSGNGGTLQVVSLEQNPALQPYFEAIRDRLIHYFEVKNLTHKPKLVGLSSASPRAGVSTLAAGLAASLSTTADGNVLLVDMNQENGAAQHFYKGKPSCGLDVALKHDTKQHALVQENLYVVSGHANHTQLQLALPKRFAALVPTLKASDFDYIIFDLPVVSPTSVTSRLARFMDATLLVVESERTNRDLVAHTHNWLTESGADVNVVLNKTRRYVPIRFRQEL